MRKATLILFGATLIAIAAPSTADRWVSNGAVTADDHWTLVDTTPDGDPRQIEDIIRRNLPDEGSGKGSRA